MPKREFTKLTVDQMTYAQLSQLAAKRNMTRAGYLRAIIDEIEQGSVANLIVEERLDFIERKLKELMKESK